MIFFAVPFFVRVPSRRLSYIGLPNHKVNLTCAVDNGIGKAADIVWDGPIIVNQPTPTEISRGVVSSSLILTNVTMFYSGVYCCTAKYSNSMCISNISSHTELVIIASPIVIRQTESPFIVNRGDNLSLHIDFQAYPSFTSVQSRGPDGHIRNTSSLTFVRIDNETRFLVQLTIKIIHVNYTHGGMYTFTASNFAGSENTSILLVVGPIVEPELILTKNGDAATFMCFTRSIPEPVIVWEMSSETDVISSGNDVDLLGTSESGNGENQIMTRPLLEFNPVQYEDNGFYKCVVSFNNSVPVSSNEVILFGK